MTIDEFFTHVQTEGFNGYTPGRGDPMGDSWAKAVGDEFDRVAGKMERGEGRHVTWLVFQWLYCLLAGMESRVIASPPAIRAAGIELTDEHVSQACKLLLASAND